MRIWYDTEFWESGNHHPIIPISVGMVAEDGRELYIELTFEWTDCDNQWLHQNVKPRLQTVRFIGSATDPLEVSGDTSPPEAAIKIASFVGEKPEFWGYYADYDHVVLCQLFGRMIGLPKGWPKYTRDVKQLADSVGFNRKNAPPKPQVQHNALQDARWTRDLWNAVTA